MDTYKGFHRYILRKTSNEPSHVKTNKVTVRPAKTQISLGIRPVRSESSLCAQWIAKDPSVTCYKQKANKTTLAQQMTEVDGKLKSGQTLAVIINHSYNNRGNGKITEIVETLRIH